MYFYCYPTYQYSFFLYIYLPPSLSLSLPKDVQMGQLLKEFQIDPQQIFWNEENQDFDPVTKFL
jgi:hypothetical protein